MVWLSRLIEAPAASTIPNRSRGRASSLQIRVNLQKCIRAQKALQCARRSWRDPVPIGVKLEGRLRIPSAILGGGGIEIRSRSASRDPSGRRAQTRQSRKAFSDAGPRVRILLPPPESRVNFRFLSGGAPSAVRSGIGHECRAHDLQTLALARRARTKSPTARFHCRRVELSDLLSAAGRWQGMDRRNLPVLIGLKDMHRTGSARRWHTCTGEEHG